uniref:nitrophenyl compound nitroreductase subunit ArsF family protein n=1 Tax=uncultured Draconibacterium sp. TaxID=1573823 RepID=UPI0032180F5E
MKTAKSILLTVFVMLFVFAASAETLQNNKTEGAKTEVYYFHNTRRCPTCLAIEKVTKEVLEEQPYASAKKNGELLFKSYNAEDSANKKLVKKMGVTGSALIVVKGDKKTDLTSKGFMYALKQPEKLQEALRKALND